MANWGPFMIERFGSEELKEMYFPRLASGECLMAQGMTEPQAGSALTDLTTTATVTGDEVVVNGRKFFTTYGQYATDVIVFARFGDSVGARGIGAVIVPTDTPGFSVIRELPTMAHVAGATEAETGYENCVVPVSNVLVWGDPEATDAFRDLIASYDAQRAGAAARALGLAQGALDEALDWSKNRVQFGRRICEFQGIQWMLATMAIQVETARAICYKAAADIDSNSEQGGLSTAVAKAFCNEVALKVADDALQILGARGYMRGEFTVERRVRHARMLPIAGGTHQMLLNLVASRVLGEKFSQRAP
jgi:alkylation response protein AidB-like acyl-CoA dehydrogenase